MYTPTRSQRSKRKQTCFKCREGHYANKFSIKEKINELDINQELKNQLLRLALTDSEQSNEGEILEQNTDQNRKEKTHANDA